MIIYLETVIFIQHTKLGRKHGSVIKKESTEQKPSEGGSPGRLSNWQNQPSFAIRPR
jgi:hypothetical protein